MAELAVITGGAQGIGKSYATQLAARGVNLLLVDINETEADIVGQKLAAQHGVSVEVLAVDLTRDADLAGVAARLEGEQVDYLINSAGFGAPKAFHSIEVDAHLDMLNVHVTSLIRFCHAVLPHMRKRKSGAIINISGQAAFLYAAGNTMYGSTKCFVEAFTRNLEAGYGPKGLKIQLLVPAYIRTSFHDSPFYGAEAMRKIPNFYWMDVDTVTATSLRQLERGGLICVPGLWHKITYQVLKRRLVPNFMRRRTI